MNNFKKKMKEKIKMYSNKKYLKGYMTKEFLTSDKDADIYFYMNEYVQLFDPRTKGNQLSLDNSFYDFLRIAVFCKDTRIDDDNVAVGVAPEFCF